MSHLVSIQSYRSGIGKSTLAANIATLLAAEGRKVGLVDCNFQTPNLGHYFGIKSSADMPTLSRYAQEPDTELDSLMQLATRNIRIVADISGEIYLIPNTPSPWLTEKRDAWIDQFPQNISDLIDTYDLDFVLFDNHSGIHPIHLMQMAMSHTLIAVLQPGQQDYQGTSVLLDVSRELDLPTPIVVANEVPADYNLDAISKQLSETYPCQHAFALPYSSDLLSLNNTGIFALRHSNHPYTRIVRDLAHTLWVD